MLENGHYCIFGRTGSGKSNLAKWLYNNSNALRNIYIDTQAQAQHDRKIKGTRVQTVEQLKKAYESARHIVYTPPFQERNESIEQIQELLFIVHKIAYRGQQATEPALRLFVDEIQAYGTAQANIWDTTATQGRAIGIQLIGISQRPAKISNTILTQCHYYVFFNLLGIEAPYCKTYSLPYERIEPYVSRPYHFVVYDIGNDETTPYAPIKEIY